MSSIDVEGRTVALTNLDRVLWPRAGFAKGDMVDYYRRVASVVLPHVARRPMTLGRFPNGVDGKGWAQTECRGRPDWMATAEVTIAGGRVRNYCLVDDAPSLLWAANQGTIELHPFLATADAPDEPLVVVFDLDPGPPATVIECCRVALWLRDALERHGLEAFPKTTGSAGLHVYVPLNSPHTFARTKAFARAVAADLAAEHPDHVVDVQATAARRGKVLVDWGQNDARRSTVAPYSLRAMPLPFVSTPLEWGEVERALRRGRPELLRFEAGDVLRRIERDGDLFDPVTRLRQRLP